MAAKKSTAKKATAQKAKPQRSRDDIADAICAHIAEGDSMTDACRAEGIAMSTFCAWVAESAELGEKYARVREVRAEVRAQQIDDIATKAERGEIPPDVARVVIDARKWAASKLAPKRYGDKQTIAHEGEVKVEHSGLSPADRLAKLSELAKSNPALMDALLKAKG